MFVQMNDSDDFDDGLFVILLVNRNKGKVVDKLGYVQWLSFIVKIQWLKKNLFVLFNLLQFSGLEGIDEIFGMWMGGSVC